MNYENVLIGVTASAAVMKLPDYISCLSDNFKHIRLIITKNAAHMVEINMLSIMVDKIYVTGNNFKRDNHIKLANWADLFIILPATANVIGKTANGIADDFLTTTILAYGSDVIFCPNMNKKMWLNPIFQKNLQFLKSMNYHFVGPVKHKALVMADNKISTEYVLPDLDEFCINLRTIILGK